MFSRTSIVVLSAFIAFFVAQSRVHGKVPSMLDYHPSAVVRDIGLGLSIVGIGASIVAGTLYIVVEVERSRFEERFRKAKTHADFLALNTSFDTGTAMTVLANTILIIGLTEIGIGVPMFASGYALVKKRGSDLKTIPSYANTQTIISTGE